MRVIHFQRTSDTGHVVPWCGVWGSRDTGWTADAAGVTCVACRDVMRDGGRDGLLVEEPSLRGSVSSVRRPAPPRRRSFGLRDAWGAVRG